MGKLEEMMEATKNHGWCSKHNRTGRTVEQGRTDSGFYNIYDCCAKQGRPFQLRTYYDVRLKR